MTQKDYINSKELANLPLIYRIYHNVNPLPHPNLDKANILGILSETLSTDVQSILAD
jgi:hypothetical protein